MAREWGSDIVETPTITGGAYVGDSGEPSELSDQLQRTSSMHNGPKPCPDSPISEEHDKVAAEHTVRREEKTPDWIKRGEAARATSEEGQRELRNIDDRKSRAIDRASEKELGRRGSKQSLSPTRKSGT